MSTPDPWLQRWEERYSKEGYAYGTEPNDFLREQLEQRKPGKILFAAEGEGRNAVYAARQGWTVSAFDISTQGRAKALQLAEKNNVHLDYLVGELPTLPYLPNTFDALALIFAHFPANIKSSYHKILSTLVQPGGVVIFEAFSKDHLEYRKQNERVGGPTDIASLFSTEEIQSDFTGYEIILLEEKVVYLNEGPHHSGTGSVIRFVGRKR